MPRSALFVPTTTVTNPAITLPGPLRMHVGVISLHSNGIA
jgi:hypothetical protein